MPLSDRQMEALRAVCDALAPALEREDDPHGFWARSASDLDVAGKIADLVGRLDVRSQREFARLLDLLGSRALGATWLGPMRPVTALSPEEREAMLRRWSLSPIPVLRQGFLTLKKLAGMLFYGTSEPEAPNPNWAAIGYEGPLALPPSSAPSLSVLVPEADLTLSCDTVVVGSGAGGGVVAGELAEAGEEVIVLEKGPYVDYAGFEQREAEALDRLYEQHGALVTRDGAVSVLAGSCLGGGTTINWAGSFRTPEDVLRQWAEEHAAPHFVSDAFRQGFEALEEALGVGTERGRHNPQNEALLRGCRALGLPVEDIPRNTRAPASEAEWRALGYSGLGDRLALKQGMAETYLRRAAAHGARLLADTEAEWIVIQSGRAVGLEAVHRGPGGRRHRVTVRARRVVVAAGALHTPALLRRSGIEHPHLGRHLFLHPTVAVAARYGQPMQPWFGPMMSAVSNALTHLDGLYGVKLETPPVHPGILALALPWRSGEQHKGVMAQAEHVGAFIVLTRDRDGGVVRLDRRGRPVLHYRLSAFDRAHLLRGIVEAARIHLAAGAEEVHFPHNAAPVFRREEGEASLERLLAGIARWGWAPNRFPLFSAHQMGTCRMGGDASRHPVDPEGAVRGTRNLYVADASAFPSSSGANPMLSVQAIAHFTAQHLKNTPPSSS